MTEFVLHKTLDAESVLIRNLPLSQLRLWNEKNVPWLALIPRRNAVREIHELSAEDRATLMDEIVHASKALEKLYAPDKINVAALGNRVEQLHVHVIARFAGDPAWPNPIWGHLPNEPYLLQAIAEIKTKLNDEALWA